MFKKTMIAGFVMLFAIFAFQPVQEAEAKPNIHIGIGGFNPYYGGYDPYYGRGRYPPRYYERRYYEPRRRYYGDPRPRQRYVPRSKRRYGRVNCRQAKRIVRRSGYRRIRATDCRGKQFKFHAKRGGRWWVIGVLSKNGRMYGIHRLR